MYPFEFLIKNKETWSEYFSRLKQVTVWSVLTSTFEVVFWIFTLWFVGTAVWYVYEFLSIFTFAPEPLELTPITMKTA